MLFWFVRTFVIEVFNIAIYDIRTGKFVFNERGYQVIIFRLSGSFDTVTVIVNGIGSGSRYWRRCTVCRRSNGIINPHKRYIRGKAEWLRCRW